MNSLEDTPGRFGRLAHNVIVFGRVLRANGLAASPERIILLEHALELLGLSRRTDVKAAARSIFARSPEEAIKVDAAFDAFWRAELWPTPAAADEDEQPPDADARPRESRDEPELQGTGRFVQAEARPASVASTAEPPADTGRPITAAVGDRSQTYSFAEGLYQKDLTQLTASELELAQDLTKRQAWELGRRRSRRMKAGRGGGAFDARRTLRASLRRGGEVLRLHTRVRKTTQRDLVLLCDVSGSMDRYSRLLLQFVHTVRHAVGRVEVFVFGTRLTRITRELRHHDVWEAIEDVSRTVVDWAGGTRIGECLRTFNHVWARRTLGRGAVVLIVSDGWDRGDVVLLARELQRLQRSAYRLIWLNPLLGSPNFRPQTTGMQAALPFIDDFLPAHNLRNLAQLAQLLGAVEHHRPTRPQNVPYPQRAAGRR